MSRNGPRPRDYPSAKSSDLSRVLTSKREATRHLEDSQGTHLDPNVAAATRELEATLGTRVRIIAQIGDRGRIEIEYFSHRRSGSDLQSDCRERRT